MCHHTFRSGSKTKRTSFLFTNEGVFFRLGTKWNIFAKEKNAYIFLRKLDLSSKCFTLELAKNASFTTYFTLWSNLFCISNASACHSKDKLYNKFPWQNGSLTTTKRTVKKLSQWVFNYDCFFREKTRVVFHCQLMFYWVIVSTLTQIRITLSNHRTIN